MAHLMAWLTAGVLLLVLLGTFGPPAILRRRLLEELRPLGIHAEISRMVWRPVRGFVLDDVLLFSDRDRVTPWLRANSLRVRPRFRTWLRTGAWEVRLDLRGARFETELGLWADDLHTRGKLQLDQIRASMEIRNNLLTIEELSARLQDVHVWVSGDVPLGPLDPGAPRTGDTDWVAPIARTLADILAVVREFSFETPAILHARLRPSPHPGERIAAEAELTFRGQGVHRGFPFNRLDLLSRYEQETLHIDSARFGVLGQAELFASARVDFRNRVAGMRLRNTLPRHAVEHLSPIPLSSLLERFHLRVEGRSDVDLVFGEAPFDEFGTFLQGSLHLSDAFYRDASFPELSLELEYANQVLLLEEIQAEVGQGRLRGPATGSLRYDDRSGALRIQAQTAFNPAAILSLIDNEVAEQTLREWEFVGTPPHMSLQFHMDGREAAPRMTLDLQARDVLSRGAFFAGLDARMELDERELRIDPLRANRPGEWLEGNLRYDLAEELLHIDVLSTIRLQELAPLISPEAVALLQPYRLEGENWIKANGVVDLTDQQRNKLEGKANLNDVIWQWMKFDTLSFSFQLEGDVLTVPDIQGTLNEGTAHGTFEIRDLFDPEDARFHLAVQGGGIDLFRLVTSATDTLTTDYTGNLSLDLDLRGRLQDGEDEGFYDSLTGEGFVEIRDGELFRIPLLLGLSRILSRVVRGFGYASQSTFRANIAIRDGRIRSRDLFLEGRLLSIEGEGSIGFDQTLNGNVKVQLMNQGFFSDVVNTLLWPVRKLIEVRLSGTLDEPVWYPRNLPRELF